MSFSPRFKEVRIVVIGKEHSKESIPCRSGSWIENPNGTFNMVRWDLAVKMRADGTHPQRREDSYKGW